MSYRSVQFRTIMSSLIAVISLLATLQARSNDTTLVFANQHQQCGSTSPLFTALGDAYFDLEPATSASEQAATSRDNELLSRLHTQQFQNGWGQRVLCTGSPDQIIEHPHPILLEQISTRRIHPRGPQDAILITAFEYDEAQRRLRHETVTIPTGTENMLQLSKNSLSSSIRHRQATPIGSYLEETRIDAFFRDDNIIIRQSLFVNGTLAQWHTWHLPG